MLRPSHRTFLPRTPAATALVALIALAAGCSARQEPPAAANAAPPIKTREQKIASIQNDRNLPPALKERMLREMQQGGR